MSSHKRRANNEGSYTQRKDGLWEARISHEGRRFSAYAPTREEARLKLRELQRKQDQGLPLVTSRTTLGQWLGMWLDGLTASRKPRTVMGYRSISRLYVIPTLGSVPLAKLTPELIEGLIGNLTRAGHRRSALNVYTMLGTSLNAAIKRRIIYANPLKALDRPTAGRKEITTLEGPDVRRFLDAAQDTPYHAVFHTALYTGLRRAELAALRWKDLDIDMGTLSVIQSVQRIARESIIQEPKTARSRRLVDLTPSSVLVLKRHLEQQEANALLFGYALAPDSPVFAYPDGRPMLPDTLSHAWGKIAGKAGLSGVRLHDGRHTHASLMLKQGVHPKVVQERLGHASITTTLDLYSHVTPGIQKAAALAFEQGMSPAPQGAERGQLA